MGVKQGHTKCENQDHSFWGESSKRWSVPWLRRRRGFDPKTQSLKSVQENPLWFLQISIYRQTPKLGFFMGSGSNINWVKF